MPFGDIHLVGKQFAVAKTLSLRDILVRTESHCNHTPTPHSEHPRSRLADAARAAGGDQCHRPSVILDWFHVYHYRVVVSESRHGDSSRMEQATC